jgi:hypothetical protein
MREIAALTVVGYHMQLPAIPTWNWLDALIYEVFVAFMSGARDLIRPLRSLPFCNVPA